METAAAASNDRAVKGSPVRLLTAHALALCNHLDSPRPFYEHPFTPQTPSPALAVDEQQASIFNH